MTGRETRIPKGSVLHRRGGIYRVFSHIAHKRRNVRFKGLRRVHTPPQPITAHTAAYTAKHGAFWKGALSLPSERFARFGNPARPGLKTANFAAVGSWSDVLPKNAESLRNSDALMRVAVSRRRGPAGTRSPAAIPRFAPMGPTVFSVTATERRETYLLFHTPVRSMRLATRCRSVALSAASNCR